MAEESWPGLQIISLERKNNLPDQPIELLVRDGDFVAEIGWMGHGLQMWLQMWFITRSKDSDAIILAVQKIIEKIGSAQNLQLTRLWSSGKLLLVEGKDIKFLKQFQNLIFPNSKTPFDALPNMPIGGWSGWPYAIGSAMLLTNAFGEQISTYCILDSDYYPGGVVEKRYEDAKEKIIISPPYRSASKTKLMK